MILYGGFVDGKLDWREVDDGWGGLNWRKVSALFKRREEARVQYQDVRRIEVAEEAREKKVRKR